MNKIDVLINAYGKPYQTALSLLSLNKHSGKWIDKIWFVRDRPEETKEYGKQFILQLLPNIILYEPTDWRWINHIDEKMLTDTDYRHSIRYQYGWEKTDKDHVLTIHNDVYFTGDAVSILFSALGDHIAAGEIGLCCQCPAFHHKKCSPEKYLEYRPTLKEFLIMAKDPQGYIPTDVTNYMVCPSLRKQPWPLPSCRVNEWCALVDLKKARPITSPFGPARPFGAHVFDGIMGEREENEPWVEFKNNLGIVFDTAMAWFRDVHRLGHTCAHQDLKSITQHWSGHKALFNMELYKINEERAKNILEKEFNLKFS
ncbi:hypothetical protein [Maridesulfovibrio zosterae]|uniref:hypothetical protein n=1 Tax=Maridesulfovibrio zosterae TaxID=82171 RepID=UPI00047F42E1|nr:hypothetical protein [Maridesulfovibrio zosterae]